MGPATRNEKESQKLSQDTFTKTDGGKTKSNAIEIPAIELPKGGGAIKGIDEKFSVNAVNGTSSLSIPIPLSKARGLTPSLSLSYNSGAGNGIFGLGWNIDLPSVKRKTDKQLPVYIDDEDTFLFSGAEDLVPEFDRQPDGSFILDGNGNYIPKQKNSPDNLFIIHFYKPRIEGLFARIERWAKKDGTETRWRVITKDNVTTLFGWSAASRLADPFNPERVYEWLPEFSFDDRGNAAKYFYKPEDITGIDLTMVHNRNRYQNNNITYTNLYLDKVLYGNKSPYKQFLDPLPADNNYFFRIAFDYGTLKAGDQPDTINTWDFRADAFSEYKSGFEVRTTRLCNRVLVFHHFTGDNEYNGLVRSLNFQYDTAVEQDFTYLKSITSYGYIKKDTGDYAQKNLPPLEFTYQKHEWNKNIREITAGQLPHAPAGPDEPPFQFVDLYNEGISGILTEQAGAWYYMHNLGDGSFEKATIVKNKPSFAGLGGSLTLMDLDADGSKQLVSYGNEPKGFFELDDDNLWMPYRYFNNLPNTSFNNAFTRMVDLTGDGRPELVMAETNSITWYPSEGRKGFLPARNTISALDEEKGPHLVFADATQTIFLADMSGDGLTDLVKITNSGVCYWPNMGYGKFGSKIQMDNAPVFDHDDAFNPSFIKLADIDGSGTSDIIYLGKNKFSCYKNLSGNRFAQQPIEITGFPEIHSKAKVTVADLLGNGVACIIWSCPLQKDAHAPVRYIDLMNGKKPHIMTAYRNKMGKEVSMEYQASTKFYLDDKREGRPWITKLHFPVHCVSKTVTEDKITGHKFSVSYKYHHGYYDHTEREFRGFGMVEQVDGESFEEWKNSGAANISREDLHQQPVITKKWFHTGACIRNIKILQQYEKEYWYEEMTRQGYPVAASEKQLKDAIIIPSNGISQQYIDQLGSDEYKQALRACKGLPLRSEVFAHDAEKNGNTIAALKKELTPFSVAAHNCIIELLQPKGKNKHAIFIVKESEALTYSYDRNIEDPRISHTLNIKLDEYGNMLESASVTYPRKIVDASLPAETREAQDEHLITYTITRYTKDAFSDNSNRHRLFAEGKTFELRGVGKSQPFYYSVEDFQNILDNAHSEDAFYHELNKPLPLAKARRRLVEHIKTLYYKNDLTANLPLYDLDTLGITYESYQLAFTPQLITHLYNLSVNDPLLIEGKFVHGKDELNNDDANWWVPSGKTLYLSGAENAVNAQNRFYVPVSYKDPFGSLTKVRYYSDYFLLTEEVEDELLNKSTVITFNFRTLSPQRSKDANDNLSEAITDELGLVKALALLGKGNQADDLVGFTEETSVAEDALINDYLNPPATFNEVTNSSSLVTSARQLLLNATARYVYDFNAYINKGKPAVTSTILREMHTRKENGQANPASKLQLSFEYSSGIGNIVMKKVQAEPGWAKRARVLLNNSVIVDEIDTAPLLRWIATGKQVINNKGNVVQEYLPYFSINNVYEDKKELTETALATTRYYDVMDRMLRVEMPGGTISRMEFDSWMQATYDQNDCVMESDWYQQRTDNTRLDYIADPKEQQAAVKAALHQNTPTRVYFDPLGRAILSIEHNKNLLTNADEFYHTKVELDIEGNLRSVIDDRGNIVMSYRYDMLGNKLFQLGMDAGQRVHLNNVLGNPVRTWNERNHEFSFEYDQLHRPTIKRVINGDGVLPLNNVYEKIIYGEGIPNDKVNNLRTKTAIVYDTAGKIETSKFDYKGSTLITTRTFSKNYKDAVDWSGPNPDAKLDNGESYTSRFEYDALNRIIKQVAPDAPLNSVFLPQYNQAGLLDKVELTQSGTKEWFVRNIDYNEKAQRTKITYGNQVTTTYAYDKNTFRLIHLQTKRQNSDPLQDLYYTFDPVGNITHIQDKNIPSIFFNNVKIDNTAEYTYDALYRLREATGREHAGQLNFGNEDNWNDLPFMKQYSPTEAFAWRPYTQKYNYDHVGNISQLKHIAGGGNFTRDYSYQANNNRLQTTTVGTDTNTYNYNSYPHHPQHGYITALPHLQVMDWNFKDELKAASRQKMISGSPETTYYVYDGNGQRARKITERQAASGVPDPPKKNQRIYVGGIEVYREYDNAGLKNLERLSYHVLDGKQRIALVENRTQGDDGTQAKLVRYQFSNHIGSSALETDDSINARVISYEEYHPFGTTSYQAVNKDIKSAARRYRYLGLERDEETGLEYHNARYYLPWLGRWLNPDPIGIEDGVNLYAYCKGNPVLFKDVMGTQSTPPPDQLHLIEQFSIQTRATNSSYSQEANIRIYVRNMAMCFGENPDDYQSGHHPSTPQWSTPPGGTQWLGPQHRLANAQQSVQEAADRRAAAAAGLYVRTDRAHTGPPIPNPPPTVLDPGVRAVIRMTPSPVTVTPPPIFTVPDSTAGTTTPRFSTGPVQLSFPGLEPESQLSFDFNRPQSTPSTQTAPTTPLVQLSFDFDGPPAQTPAVRPSTPTPRPTPVRTPSGGPSVGSQMGTALIPGAAEAVVTTEALVPFAAQQGMPRLFAAAAAGAKSPGPGLVGGVVGAPVGVLAEGAARDAGMGEAASTGIGATSAVVTGAGVAMGVAAVGAVIVSAPITVPLLAGAALVGGLTAGFGYLMSRAMR